MSKKTEHARTISYRWWRTDGGEVVPAHIEPLDDHAAERILSAFQEGCINGSLANSVRSTDEPETEVYYAGWWETKRGVPA